MKAEVSITPDNPKKKPTLRLPGYETLATVAMSLIVFLVIFPIGRILTRTFVIDGRVTLEPTIDVITQPWFVTVLLNTIALVLTTTAICVLIGTLLAWLNERTDANLGVIGFILPIVPMLIPSTALAIGWVFLAEPKVGFINGFMQSMPLIGQGGINARVNIYSWGGLIWVYVIHGIPYVYLVVAAALQGMDPALEEASQVSGASIWRTFLRVSLPSILPALIASSLLVVLTGFGLYSIPVIIATPAEIDLLPVRLVRMLTNEYPPRIAEAQVLGIVMLVIIGTLWYLQRKIMKRGSHVMQGGRSTGGARLPLGRWKFAARSLMFAYMGCATVLPLAALVIVALQPFWTPSIDVTQFTLRHFENVLFINSMTVAAFKNSLLISAAGATIAMSLAAIAAIQVVRRAHLISHAVDVIIKLPAIVPNLVISLGFLIAFAGAPFFLSGTISLLLMAYVIMYVPPGSIAANAAVAQVGSDLREASQIAGATEGRTVSRIVLPLALPGFVAGWTIVFVHMMGDLSGAALLSSIGNPVVGFAILTIWDAGSFGQLAAFSTLMCVVITVIVALGAWFARPRARRGS